MRCSLAAGRRSGLPWAHRQPSRGREAAAPLGRASTAEDVAAAVLLLVDGAPTMTGELLLLDAGMHLGATQTARTPGKP